MGYRTLRKFELTKSRGVFHQPLLTKTFRIKRKQGRHGEKLRPEYSSGDRYGIRVVKGSLIAQLKPTHVCANLNCFLFLWSAQTFTEKAMFVGSSADPCCWNTNTYLILKTWPHPLKITTCMPGKQLISFPLNWCNCSDVFLFKFIQSFLLLGFVIVRSFV